MKKIYSFAFAAVAILSAASCQKEELTNNETLLGGGNFTVTATIAETKTVLDGVNVLWSPGDKISLFNNEGNSVAFSTDITEPAAVAKFTNTAEYTAPETIYAVYPDRGGVQKLTDGIINNFRIAGDQTAVAGSFDPAYGSAVGVSDVNGNITFKSINSLIKFTIGGEKAPAKVTFTNGGARNIAGLFTYNTITGAVNSGDGAKAISLTPAAGDAFEVGETYYIAVIPGGNFANMTLDFDGTVVRTVEGAKYADETNDFLVGKIINLGTVAFPEESEQPEIEIPFNIERVWGYFSTTTTPWYNEIADGFKGSWFGGDTSLAMDDEYIYMPYGTGTAGVYKISLATGAISNIPVDGISGGTYPTSCARMVKNNNPEINGGKDILLVGNLALANEPLKFYAYVNGTDQAPVVAYNLVAARRFGDKFSVSGTWQSGKIWLRSNQNDPLEAIIPITNGALQTWIDAYRITNADQNCISEISWYPADNGTVADYCLMSTTSDLGVHLMKGCSTAGSATEEGTYSDLAKTFGYNFFEVGGQKYITCTSLKYGNDKPRLQIFKGDGSSLATLKDALANFKENLVVEYALSNEANNLLDGGNAAAKTLCDCAVRVINNEIYIAALGEQAGLSLFKVTAK